MARLGTLAELAQLGKQRGETYPPACAAAFFGDCGGRALEKTISNTVKLIKNVMSPVGGTTQ